MSTLARLLSESWSHVEERADDLANYFYAAIFRADPGLRDMFPVEMRPQRMRLLASLVATIRLVDDPQRLDEYLRGLGRDHRKFHVSPEHYGIVGVALLTTLRTYSGERWTVEYEQAWRDAYDLIASKMITGAAADCDRPAFWHATVVRHERRGRDIAVLRCEPLSPFTFRAGQYVNVECRYQPRVWRTYSIANAPRPDGSLDFHVRARDGGWVSAALVRRLRVGDLIRIGPPMGSMTLDPDSTRDIVCVSGGTGLAPIKALVEELTRGNRSRWVHVFVGAHDRDELYDLPELVRLSRRYPWLSVVAMCADDPSFPGERGTVSEVVERYGPWHDHDFFVCGSPEMVKATFEALNRMSVPRNRVRYDAMVGVTEARPAQ